MYGANQPPKAYPETLNSLQKVMLRNGDFVNIDKPIFGAEYVQETTSIRGYEYLGEVTIPTRIETAETQTQSFRVFRATRNLTVPLEQSGQASPALQLVYTTFLNKLGSVTLIDQQSFEHLMNMNSRSIAQRSDEAALQEWSERRALHTAVIHPGESLTIGQDAAFHDLFGSEASATSPEHFMLEVTPNKVVVRDTSFNGTMITVASGNVVERSGESHSS